MAGLAEEQCKAQVMDIKVGQRFYRANGKAVAMAESDGLCKLIFNKADDRLVGIHIMGAQAADLAQQGVDLMNAGATCESMKSVIFGHPTISEVILAALHAVK